MRLVINDRANTYDAKPGDETTEPKPYSSGKKHGLMSNIHTQYMLLTVCNVAESGLFSMRQCVPVSNLHKTCSNQTHTKASHLLVARPLYHTA